MLAVMRILTIDGGGIRGLVPATVLRELEHRAGAPVVELFDLVVGSSTGAILGLGLTAPAAGGTTPRYTAGELVRLYLEEGPRIFSRPLWHRLRAVGNLLGPKYPDGPLEDVLGAYLGGTRLRETLLPVVATAYELELRAPFFFRTTRAVADPAYDWDLAEVARASSAAPTYFSPALLRAADDDPNAAYALVDGGVFANNPTMVAYVEARRTAPEADLTIVSLGTGEQTRPLPYRDARGWGLVRWARPILDVVLDGVSDTVDHEVETLAETRDPGSPRYWRLQPTLPPTVGDIDDASSDNLGRLRAAADRLVAEHDGELDAIVAATT